MCGLTGVLIGGNPRKRTLEEIGDVFTSSLLANEERGKEATGVASVNSSGEVLMEKSPVRASIFVKGRAYEAFMENFVEKGSTILLGHTRRPTKGSPSNNANNHPIVVENTIGIHNGTITNDDEIFLSMDRRTDRRRKRIGSVDSEAIFALMEDLDFSKPAENWGKEMREAASLLVGSYTTLFFNRSFPRILFLLKYDKPISIHYSPELNSLFFCSRYVFLRKAFGRSVVTEALPSKTGYVFDAHLLTEYRKTPFMKFDLHQLTKKIPFLEK